MSCKGFTLTELLIVIGITMILASASLPIYSNLQVSAQLGETSAQVSQALRIARNNSLNRVNSQVHGVKFEIDRYILYQGGSYVSRDITYDREVELSDSLSLSTDLFGDEVVFSKSFGLPNTTGTITLTHDVEGVSTISLNDLGVTEEE
jgi:prepilin-type N-terminal cleavage/methylation domain-containing protein